MDDSIGSMANQIDQQQVTEDLVSRSREEGVDLVGPDGTLTGLTKDVVESALDAEMSDHLGYDKHDSAGRDGQNSRNGTRTKTVLAEVGPIQIEVPRDRDGSFEPAIVKKRRRRLDGIDRPRAVADSPRSDYRGVRRALRRGLRGAGLERTRSAGSVTRSSRT